VLNHSNICPNKNTSGLYPNTQTIKGYEEFSKNKKTMLHPPLIDRTFKEEW